MRGSASIAHKSFEPLELYAIVCRWGYAAAALIGRWNFLVSDVIGNRRGGERLQARGGVYVVANVAGAEEQLAVDIGGGGIFNGYFAVPA